jgi:hypothetical protein
MVVVHVYVVVQHDAFEGLTHAKPPLWLLPSCALGLITTPRLPIGIPPIIVTREDRSSILKSIDVLVCSPIRTVAPLCHVES